VGRGGGGTKEGKKSLKGGAKSVKRKGYQKDWNTISDGWSSSWNGNNNPL